MIVNLRNFRRVVVVVVVVAVSLLTQVVADEPEKDKDFCALSFPAIGELDDTLYMLGGWWIWNHANPDFYGYNNPNNYLESISLKTPFNISNPKTITQTRLPTLIPRLSNVHLWPTSADSFTMTSGVQEITERQRLLEDPFTADRYQPKDKWTFTPSASNWTLGETDLTNLTARDGTPSPREGHPAQRVAIRTSTYIPELRKAYMINGKTAKDPYNNTRVGIETEFHTGMLEYDADTSSWRNLTAPVDSSNWNNLEHLHTKNDILLISFGGYRKPNGALWVSMNNLRDIHIFSTRLGEWFTVTVPTQLPAPQPRGMFCSSLHSAPDNSSHQITIFGGMGQESSTIDTLPEMDDTIWTLSIPSFQWVQIVPHMPKDLDYTYETRVQQTCHALKGGYTLLYAGRAQEGPDGDRPVCDKSQTRAYLWDDSGSRYVESWAPGGTYKVPEQVSKVVGGDEEGGSEVVEPAWGWGSDRNVLSEMFTFIKPPKKVVEKPNPDEVENAKETETPAPVVEEPTTNVAVIAGGACAGFAVLVLGAGLWLFLRRWKKKTKAELEAQNAQHTYFQELDSVSRGPTRQEKDGTQGIETVGMQYYTPAYTRDTKELPNTPPVEMEGNTVVTWVSMSEKEAAPAASEMEGSAPVMPTSPV